MSSYVNIPASVSMEDVISTATGDTADLTVSGLNGDLDGDYDITIDLIYKGGSGNVGFYLRPIGATDTGLTCYFTFNNGSGVLTSSGSTGGWFIVSVNDAADQHAIARIFITSKTGRLRQFYSRANFVKAASTLVLCDGSGWCTDTSTNITALTLHAASAAIRANSYIKVRKLKSTL